MPSPREILEERLGRCNAVDTMLEHLAEWIRSRILKEDPIEGYSNWAKGYNASCEDLAKELCE